VTGTGIVLLHPGLLLLALPVAAAAWFRRRRGTPAALLAPPDGGGLGDLPRTWRERLVPLPGLLEGAALLLLVVALARPAVRVPLPVRDEGIDIVLGLDLSSSMTARDLDRSRTRLEVARDEAIRFLRGRPGDRVGLVGFARYADVLCPPTADHAALEGILRAAAPVEEDGAEDATALGTAAAQAARLLAGGASRSRVLVLFTDGEENVAEARDSAALAPDEAARLCAALGVRAYAVAAGARAPGRAPPDVSALRGLASRTGGRFYEAADARAVEAVFLDLDALERTARARETWTFEDVHVLFLLAAAGLLAGAFALRGRGLEPLP
jgi:Ca-activated chloride channel family protein